MLLEFKPAGGLLARYSRLVCDSVIPFQEAAISDRVEGVAPSHAIANFKNAAIMRRTGKKPENGDFYGAVFQDSDVAKWLEAAAYSLALQPDKELESRMDEICETIAEAQEDDGYLDTYFILDHPERKLTNLLEGHELYCAGHMMEAAVAIYEVTGKTKLLSVMEKNADMLYRHFITEGADGYSGHPEVELALMRLWRATGNDKYRELAEHFINVRGVDSDYFNKEVAKRDWKIWGNDPNNKQYQQSHLPVRQQKDAVGHSVRAMYLYTAMADIAASTGEKELADACFRLFDSAVNRRMYITGGIGSTNHGEAFSADYDLPNDTVYAETCASVGLVFFASKMLRLKRDGRFADVMERVLFNTVLAGIELDGRKFFYVNPLEVVPGITGVVPIQRHVLPQRPGWFGCACCPPNAARLLASVAEYAWDQEGDTVYSNIFAAGTLTLPQAEIEVETSYPFGDTVRYEIKSGETVLAVHIPEFTKNGYSVSIPGEYRDGYYYMKVKAGDTVVLRLDMSPKLNRANPRVPRDSGLGAVTVGQIVYCAEGADNGGDVLSFSVDPSKLTRNTEKVRDIGGFPEAAFDIDEVYTVTAGGVRMKPDDPDALYFTGGYTLEPAALRLIPYFMWGNRGLNQMRIWIPVII